MFELSLVDIEKILVEGFMSMILYTNQGVELPMKYK